MRLWRSWYDKTSRIRNIGQTGTMRSASWGVLLFAVLWGGCHETLHVSPVPSNPVRYTCDPTVVNLAMQQGPPQTGLDSPGGYVRCWDRSYLGPNEAWGTGGLLILQSFTPNTFYAFDLACPNCYAATTNSASRLHQLMMADDGVTARCTNCNSEFGAIFWGSPAPTKGPANQNNYPLRTYRATQVGNKVTVSN
ncbi:MAG: hypothetical protein J6Y99_01950 [Bacteroidales bacterium]|nr:hypothetical protein [Bacteroidales bacterium]